MFGHFSTHGRVKKDQTSPGLVIPTRTNHTSKCEHIEHVSLDRSNQAELFYAIDVPLNYAKFREKPLRWSHFQ